MEAIEKLIKEDEVTDKEWLALAMKGGAFDFLNDPAENIYTMENGIPYKSKSDEIKIVLKSEATT